MTLGVPWWLSGLRCYHCCGVGSIPRLELWLDKKKILILTWEELFLKEYCSSESKTGETSRGVGRGWLAQVRRPDSTPQAQHVLQAAFQTHPDGRTGGSLRPAKIGAGNTFCPLELPSWLSGNESN